MRFTCKIDMDNAAFDGGEAPAELATILRDLAYKLERRSETNGNLSDCNGNTVGEWKITGKGWPT